MQLAVSPEGSPAPVGPDKPPTPRHGRVRNAPCGPLQHQEQHAKKCASGAVQGVDGGLTTPFGNRPIRPEPGGWLITATEGLRWPALQFEIVAEQSVTAAEDH